MGELERGSGVCLRNGFRDLCGLNPEFGHGDMEEEAEPEGGAENCVKVEGGGAASGDSDGYEQANDGADGGYGQADGESADHPLAVKDKFAAADVEEGLGEGEEEIEAKDGGSGRLREAADCGHGEAHDQSGEAYDGGGDQEDAPGDAVALWVAGADGAIELERAEGDEEGGWQDVDECEDRVTREDIVGGGELGEGGIGWQSWRVVAVQ